MQNYDHLGQVFKNLRTNRHISLKQISNERVSAAQISRFERGESDISLEKFLIALSNMHIEVSEFMDAVNNYQRTEQIRFMSALIPLEYERNIAGFQKMQAEEADGCSFNGHAQNGRGVGVFRTSGYLPPSPKCDPASELYLQMRCNGSISGRVH